MGCLVAFQYSDEYVRSPAVLRNIKMLELQADCWWMYGFWNTFEVILTVFSFVCLLHHLVPPDRNQAFFLPVSWSSKESLVIGVISERQVLRYVWIFPYVCAKLSFYALCDEATT